MLGIIGAMDVEVRTIKDKMTGTVTTRYPIFRKVWYAFGYPGFSMSTVFYPPRSCVSKISRYSFPAPSTMFSGRQFTPLA